MRFLIDESVDRQIVERLRRDGHLVLSVAELQPRLPDDRVVDLANQESTVLVTADKDFGELVFRQGRVTAGVVLIRLAGLSPDRKADIVSVEIRAHSGEIERAFTVITPGTVRVRRQRH